MALGWTKNDQALLNQIPNTTTYLLVGNKADLQNKANLDRNSTTTPSIKSDVTFSALTGEAEEVLINALLINYYLLNN